FFGTWYVLKRFQNPLQNGDCATLDFVAQNGSLTVYNRAVENNFLNEINNPATLQNGTAKFSISINEFQPLDFWILPTALYTDNSLGYSCANLNSTHKNVYIWQLGRSTAIGDMIEANLNQTLLSLLGISIESLTVVDHSEAACTVLPDILPGEQVILPGSCNENMRVVQNFSASAFTGVWHEISSYASVNEIGSCRKADYQLMGSAVSVRNSEVVNQALRVISGNASISSSDGSAKLEVVLEVAPGNFPKSSLWVLATDYTNYAVSYTCVNLPDNRRRVSSWILSRSRQLSQSAQIAVDAVIRSEVDLNTRFYVPTNQSDDDCFYYPDPVPGQPVVFPGQCDETIQAIPRFNASRYMGRWYNIESYPATSINGTCSKALYTLMDNYVQVNNSQVVNQRLDSITGSAVINSTDLSGKLLVSFPSTGNTPNTANYYVLDTDYDSYAVVYSCRNKNSEERVVTGFKLGRNKELNSSALAAIDRAMSPIPVMDQRYFVRGNHSEESCFYYPEPQEGVPVVFPGRCDDNINVVQNFNLTEFAGTWYEIQSYPTNEKRSQCVNHVLTQVSNTAFSAVSSSVIDQFKNVFNSTISVASGNNTAKMIMTIRSENNEASEIPFWILDTDYSNYALAYGCKNRDEDRLVYSWKLSRSRQLSQNNITAISNTMSKVNVLEDRYFETKSHTAASCFFLPDIPKGEPVIIDGQCDLNIPVVQNFSASAYLGNWRLIESYASNFQNGTCNRANYLSANNTIVVRNSQVNNQSLTVVEGSAWLLSSGKLEVDLPDTNRTIEYWVLDTDYSSYSLVYSCENLDATRRRVWSWKMSRTRDLSPNAIQNINRIVDSIDVLNNRYYEVLDHSDDGCFYLPTPDQNSQVIFPGQCDPNINVVTSFDAVGYMNLWHDIESYPTQFQNGTCNNALYTLLPNGTVDVLNTQVINQSLDSIKGSARLASNDSSAKLIVTFPAGNGFVETPYWVLGTDYYSYALVYTCVNLDDERRLVWSWKLSRTKQLSPNASAEIDRIVNNIPVLNEQYYVKRDQTKEGCFYYPEPQPGKVVELPGQCENVQGISNFNMSLFEGVWHEIEAYPKEQQSGQCISHDYTVTSARTLNLFSSNVIDQELRVTNSTVTFASNQETNGNLIITLNSGGQVVQIPYIVLSTDYENYALAYSCVNSTKDFRKVFSWKLSRSKFLSNESLVAIDKAMANITVLENRYYENINQTDNACFYLPKPEPGKPVTFVGQCDESIPVVSNFAAASYLGRWLLIETYPTVNQKGECNDALYSLNSDNSTVDVYNTEVLDQELLTINGTAVLAYNDGSAKLNVSFPTTTVPSPYWVLDTDYTSFALVYTCRNNEDNTRTVTSFKLSRNNTLSPEAIARINQKISQIDVLDDRYFNKVNRTDDACFYYPNPGPESPIFRGRCDENISVVQNFNATAYLGVWYDISSYPVRFQYGTCPTATYEASSVGVNVFNTEVVDQRLSTIRGSAVIDSNDGSAKLLVSFPIAELNATTKSPYWVLATDYNNYALVYSCSNEGENSRRVSSWQLSRNKFLSQESLNEINNKINSVPVLNEIRGHSDENCFYYPENNGGPVVQFGQCANNLSIVNNFNISSFAGSWFEISRFPSELQNGECVNSIFEVNNQNISMRKSMIFNERMINVFGNAVVSSDAIITVNLTNENGDRFATRFQVLDVDYNDFALLHNCRNLNSSHKQVYSWKLSRSKSGLSPAAITRINQLVSNTSELFEDYYDVTDQTSRGCFYYPDFPQPPSSIILPGPCNETIRAKSNFNTTAYLGKWYEIASYPQAFQDGECARAQYSAGNNVVNVLNTQVINRTLDVQTATAVVASNDNSGLLNVTFVLSNGDINVVNYYVLETDYTSYSLVYSCRNTDDGNRQVSSWKLSRDKVLPNNSIPIIDNIIKDTQGLREEYYRTTSQSDEDCFYIPEFDRTKAPVFRGQCQNITGMQGFDAQRYLGWWHEIQRYPTDNDSGTCISSNFRANGNQIQVTDTNIFGTSSQVAVNNVTISNDGRIRRISSNGNIDDIWVLTTDYHNYSLLYSCENVNSSYKRVWSAKHSKDRQLTPEAELAMASLINNTKALEPQFYIPVNQSDEACFHYPEQSGDQIILPGQCDPNIPVMQNFDAVKYTGTWYQIEKYPQRFENGTCIGARYTLDEQTGVVDVLNWQVVNGTLDTIEGNATIISTDGSAKLIVNLPIRGRNESGTVSMELYVLTTDYVTYSLAYSCVNINKFERSVAAWKLSRTRTMINQSNSEINAYMNSREELHQPYFERVEQNDDCEEPNSSYLARSSIILILVCSVLRFLY
ncbi:chlorophyllide A binding protein precursor, partial [Danaus plexippus plexippus]